MQTSRKAVKALQTAIRQLEAARRNLVKAGLRPRDAGDGEGECPIASLDVALHHVDAALVDASDALK